MSAQNLDDQYRRPTGELGKRAGEQMARDHLPENLWTVAVLRAAPTDHVLELGFGPGVAIRELSKVVTQGRITGIDFSEAMLAAASRLNAEAIHSGLVDLYHGDVSRLPFETEAFDKAYSIHSIYFWPEPREVLKEVYRVLKPGGVLVLTVLPKESWTPNEPDGSLGTPECIPYSGEDLVRMLADVNFKMIWKEVDSNPENRSSFCVIGKK